MRGLLGKLLIIVLAATLFIPALAGAQNLSGTYALYQKGNESRGVVGYMQISQQSGNNFSVGIASPTGNPAVDWQGQGNIQGNSGFYTWRFGDGKTGQTTFSVDHAGNLHGQVRGSGINWDYLAQKM
jgi:hypothetical protein